MVRPHRLLQRDLHAIHGGNNGNSGNNYTRSESCTSSLFHRKNGLRLAVLSALLAFSSTLLLMNENNVLDDFYYANPRRLDGVDSHGTRGMSDDLQDEEEVANNNKNSDNDAKVLQLQQPDFMLRFSQQLEEQLSLLQTQQQQQQQNPNHLIPQWNLNFPNPDIISQQHLPTLQEYNLDNVKITLPTFYRELFVLYYNPVRDAFEIYIDETRDKWTNPNRNRVNILMSMIAYSLRTNFPERFRGKGSKEFVVMISSGDEPKLKCECVDLDSAAAAASGSDDRGADNNSGKDDVAKKGPCQNELFAPILQFGSVYKDPNVIPNMVTMPVWSHVNCFRDWMVHSKRRVGKFAGVGGGSNGDDKIPECFGKQGLIAGVLGGEDALRKMEKEQRMSGVGGIDVNGKEMELMSSEKVWDKLIPQVIWRGTDFEFLHCVYRVRHAEFAKDIIPRLEKPDAKYGYNTRGVTKSLMESWNRLTPRWRAAALTAMAELEWKESNGRDLPKILPEHYTESDSTSGSRSSAISNYKKKGLSSLPWIDSKFAHRDAFFGQSAEFEKLNQRYAPFQEYDVHPVGGRMSPSDLSYYKYHVDFGGGGGTTYEGTKDKLSMPGVLFHHSTPTKDYFHDDLQEWIHFIPMSHDISDLRQKFEWAEANPVETRLIAERATKFAKFMATPEFMDGMYERYFVHSLKRVIDAYVPWDDIVHVSGEGGESTLEGKLEEVLMGFTLIGKCEGKNWYSYADCSYVKDPV